MPGLLLSEFADTKDEGAFEGYGRRVARELLKPYAEYVMGEFNVANAVEVLRRASRYSGRFGFDFGDGRDSASHVLILRHDQGPRWSRFYAGVLDEAFRVLLGQRMELTYTHAICVAQLSTRGD